MLPFWIMWRLWKSRNAFLFQKIHRSPNDEAIEGNKDALEWFEANNQEENDRDIGRYTGMYNRESQWSPPPNGWLKCNFDSGFSQQRPFTNTGWIIRDHKGHVITVGCARLQSSNSSLQAEAFGFLHVLQVTWALGMRHVWFEGDNKGLVNLINTESDHSMLGTLLYDIRHWMSKLPLSSLGYVNREKNAAADLLSKHASVIKSMYSFSVPPSWLINLLYYPYSV